MRQGETIEFSWAVEQLEALGYVKSHGPGEVRLTAAGAQKAEEIDRSIQIMDRIILLLHHAEILTGGEHE